MDVPVGSVSYAMSFSSAYLCLRAKWLFATRSWRHLWVQYLSIDIFLGLALLLVDVDEVVLSETISDQFDSFIGFLQSLLEWLIEGNPAGLKLNKPLNTAVGNFFLYHLYLWQTYITFLTPTLQYAMYLIRYAGVLGVSMQLSLVSDFVMILSLHISCFYVYASRIYQLQVASLKSLWNLFRGKKYNSLRRRVDSFEYDGQMLFLGTLLFTALLFLLPTTACYYLVFSFLKLGLVAVCRCLTSLRSCLSRFSLSFDWHGDGKSLEAGWTDQLKSVVVSFLNGNPF